MPIKVLSRNYSTRNHAAGNNFQLSNVGQITTDKIEFLVDYGFMSTADVQVQFLSIYSFRIIGVEIADLGWTIGSTLTLTGQIDTGSATAVFAAMVRTIESIDGDTVTVTVTLDPGSSGIVVGAVMPMGAGTASNTQLLIFSSITDSEVFDVHHNQVLNSNSGSIYSLFDGEVNRFQYEGVNSMSIGDAEDMVQLGKKSGGSYISTVLERLADVGSKKSYRITFVYFNPYIFFDSDFEEPSCYEAANTIKPFYQIKALPEANNPNSALSITHCPQLGNVGWKNENYNQGINDFVVASADLTTSTGSPLVAVDFNQTTHVVATITGSANFTDFAEIQFNLIPEISTVKNQLLSQKETICLSNCYFDVSASTDIKQQFGVGGAEIVIDNVDITVGTNETILEFDLVPNAEFTAYVEAMLPEDRKCSLVATVESVGGDENNNNSVTLILFEGVLEEAPVIGGPYDYVDFNGFFNHSQPITGVSELVYNGCTEDDFLYVSRFKLRKDASWSRLDVTVRIVNDTTGQYFDLLTRSVPFSPYFVDVNNVIHIDYLETIGQALDSPDRNKLEVKNVDPNPSLDSIYYDVQIIWSLMASWRYWIAQNNALIEFFDATLPQSGRNNEWMRYLREAGYSLQTRCLLVNPSDVGYYWGSAMNLQDYDDSPDITSVIKYYDSANVEQTALVQGEMMRVEAIHTLTGSAWDPADLWGWIGFRPFESESMRRISTVWDWTSQNLPLRPLTGETKATISFPSVDVAVVEALIDTTFLNVNNYTVVSRIESPIYPTCISPIDYLFDAVIAGSNYETDYASVLDKFITNGMDVSHANICCPTCSVRIGDLLDVEIYAFGPKALLSPLVGTFTGAPCCRDEYGSLDACETDFTTLVDDLMDEVTGDTAALLAALPSQINTYSDTNFSRIAERVISLSTDETIRFAVLAVLVLKGFKFTCVDGVKQISKL